MNLDELLNNPLLIGSDLETVSFDYGVLVRGPIERVVVDGGIVYFEREWSAFYDRELGLWVYTKYPESLECGEQEIALRLGADGRIMIVCPGVRTANIFTDKGWCLNPASVRRLDLDHLPLG